MPFSFRIKSSLLWTIVLAMLVAGLLPLLWMSYTAFNGYQAASDQATTLAAQSLDEKSLDSLQLRTTQTARQITQFLEGIVNDTLTAAQLPRTSDAYLTFYQARQGQLWYTRGTTEAAEEQREQASLYREVAYIGANGTERLRIQDGRVLPPSMLRDVSDPANTTYRSEDYFTQTRALARGEVYVSHVTAWHTSVAQQPASQAEPDALEGSKYTSYEAVIRFATPVFAANGDFDGIVLLSLDHRHLMEFSMHILPTTETKWTAWPDYASGNYAFLFDDQGYTIAHPLLSRIRGLDAQGQLITPLSKQLSPDQAKQHPFNLQAAGWADQNFPKMYDAVLQGKENFAITVNQAGARKASVYAPIAFQHGVYSKSGVFGGIVVGANMAEFHKAANAVRESIEAERARLQTQTLWIAAFAAALLVATALLVTRQITRPVLRLTEAARAMKRGELDVAVLDRLLERRITDEVTTLTRVFKQMAEQVQLRERKLKQEIAELHIQIDEQKQDHQVAEITDTDYFRTLQAKASRMRARVSDLAEDAVVSEA